jgi:hypothetical protein
LTGAAFPTVEGEDPGWWANARDRDRERRKIAQHRACGESLESWRRANLAFFMLVSIAPRLFPPIIVDAESAKVGVGCMDWDRSASLRQI